MSIIIDGMTQSTTSLPHFERQPSWLSKIEYDVHVIGSIIETAGVHLEFSYKNIGDNSNVLIDSIVACIRRMHAYRTGKGQPFPTVLYLQLDNVSSNKSKVLMTFLSWLVETNIFHKIKVNYLLVGHTHEIIDQVFSRYSVALRKKTCLTLGALMEVATTCYTPRPTVAHVTSVTDWEAFFKENGCLSQNTKDISYNHAFRIKRFECDDSEQNESHKILIHSKTLGYRESATERKGWGPKGGCQQLLSLPEGLPKPQQLIPLDDKQMDELERIITGFEKNIGPAFSGDTRRYWERQLEFQKLLVEGNEESTASHGEWSYKPLSRCSENILQGILMFILDVSSSHFIFDI